MVFGFAQVDEKLHARTEDRIEMVLVLQRPAHQPESLPVLQIVQGQDQRLRQAESFAAGIGADGGQFLGHRAYRKEIGHFRIQRPAQLRIQQPAQRCRPGRVAQLADALSGGALDTPIGIPEQRHQGSQLTTGHGGADALSGRVGGRQRHGGWQCTQ